MLILTNALAGLIALVITLPTMMQYLNQGNTIPVLLMTLIIF